MKFNDFLQRASLNSIQSFLKDGSEYFGVGCEKTYSKRIEEAERKAMDFFKARFANIKEFDEIAGYFYEQVSVYEEVYFEIGLILGAKVAFQISERINELK